MLDLGDDDPRTLEEVRIKQEYSYKHNAAIESEKAIKVIHVNNKYDDIVDKITHDLFDFGVGGVRDYIDPNGRIKIKHSKMKNFISSYCEEEDFSDAYYMGEVIFMGMDEIQDYGEFEKNELEEISNLNGGNWFRNQRKTTTQYEDDKIAVLDFEIKSFNSKYYEKRVNKFGNKEIVKTKFGKKSDKKEIVKDGYQVIYRGKWIIETDYIFDYGLGRDMKRAKNSLKETSFSWHVFAPSQDEMNFFGVVEAMIPVADMVQIMWLKTQQMVLKMVPPGIAFDLDALDNINLGHAGEVFKPRKVLEMYWQKGDYPFRSKNKDSGDLEPHNRQPIMPISSPVTGEIQNIASIINIFLNLMRDNIGFNEVTDGSTPDARMLNGVANMAYQATSNALSHIVRGRKRINEEVANSLVIRIQDAISNGNKIYIKALGINSHRFWKVNSNVSMHDIAIRYEDKPDDQQVAILNKRIEIAEHSGQITIADSCYIDTIDNVKEKAAVLAYLVRKNLDRQQAMKQQDIQANGQVQQQSAITSEEEARKTEALRVEGKMKTINLEKEWDYKIEMLKQSSRAQEANIREEGRVITKQIENQGKERIKEMDN
jgi:hypothetical protein